MRRLALSLIACVLACGPRPTTTPQEPAPDTDVADDAAGSLPFGTGEPSHRVPGVGHTAQIDAVTLAPDGSAALTRDTLGSLRLWPALDGSAEPQVVPVQSANQFSVARVGDHFIVLAVDGSGGARAFEMDVDGTSKPQANLPPTKPIIEGHVLPDGRLLVLFRDRTIGLVDCETGERSATFDERRFRPERLLVAADGRAAVALLSKSREGGKAKMELVPLRIDAKAKKIERTGNPRLASAQMGFSPHDSALSPDGKSFAYLDLHDGTSFHVGVVRLDDNEPAKEFKGTMRSHGGIGVGFVDAQHLLVSPADGSLSTMIDLSDGSMRPRPGPPNDFNHQGRAQRVRSGRQVMGYGAWLYVQDVDAGAHRFLGYDTVQAQSVALSPDDSHVAWGFLLGSVLVESFDGEEAPVTLELEARNATPWKLRFIDDAHLLVVDGIGNIELYRWRQRQVVARAGFIGSMRNLDFDASTGLVAVDRHFNDLRVFHVADGKLEGPWLVNDGATRFGLLRASSSSDPVLWTLDGSSKLRHYTRDQLERGLSNEEVEDLAESLKQGQPVPLALGRDGRQYGARYEAGNYELFVDLGDKLHAIKAPTQNITAMHVAPDGETVAAVSTGTNSSVTLLDAQTLETKWTFGGGGFVTDLVWSPDGKFLGLATQTGAVVLDAGTGEIASKRCGLGFQVVHAPPSTAFSTINQRAVCER
jgi:WD40 repeat protein